MSWISRSLFKEDGVKKKNKEDGVKYYQEIE